VGGAEDFKSRAGNHILDKQNTALHKNPTPNKRFNNHVNDSIFLLHVGFGAKGDDEGGEG